MTPRTLSRRRLLIRSAVTATAGVAAAQLWTVASARAAVDPVPNPSADVDRLNVLLGLEYDAVAFYGAAAPSVASGGTVLTGPGTTRIRWSTVLYYFHTLHQEYVAALSDFIRATQGTPVSTGTAGPPDVARNDLMFAVARNLEQRMAYTYADALQTLSTQSAAKLVASIGTVASQRFIALDRGYTRDGIAVDPATYCVRDGGYCGLPWNFAVDTGIAGSRTIEDYAGLDAVLAYAPLP